MSDNFLLAAVLCWLVFMAMISVAFAQDGRPKGPIVREMTQVACLMDQAEARRWLREEHGEQDVAFAIGEKASVVTSYDPADGSWSVMLYAKGRACMLASGKGDVLVQEPQAVVPGVDG